MSQDNYAAFVQGKRRSEVATGDSPGELNEHLFDFQHAIVSWACRRGRAVPRNRGKHQFPPQTV